VAPARTSSCPPSLHDALPIFGLILVNAVRPGVGLEPALVQELLASYRSQAQGLQAGGGGKFGIDMFVNIVPRNPIQAAASIGLRSEEHTSELQSRFDLVCRLL